jgi:glucokinase
MRTGERVVLGVDIGGTKVAAGLVNSAGEVVYSARRRMIVNKSAADALRPVLDAIDAVFDKHKARPPAIGVSVPGWVDAQRGVLLSATNVPCWQDYPLAHQLESRYRVPVRLANDANMAALAEAVWGAGAPYRHVFYVSLGTGIGTGIVIEHRLYQGRTGAAGEGGHMTINFQGPRCGCGKRGCIEMYASGTAIGVRARDRLSAQRSTSRMLDLADGKIANVTAVTVGKAALDGDPLANEILRETSDYLAIWLGNIIDLLDIDVIIIGGGLGELIGSFFSYIREQLEEWAISPRRQEIPIAGALYRSESSLVGAAAFCMPRSRRAMMGPR